ncbi:hypothetical protein AB0A77_18970 [Streptomyces varsoviensis]|uniref:TolB family protein n=1 Tax=Streptomyces varsoviensis TaxID=67373 RepID=UPI0033FD2420
MSAAVRATAAVLALGAALAAGALPATATAADEPPARPYTERISHAPDGAQWDAVSFGPSFGDGANVSFTSDAGGRSHAYYAGRSVSYGYNGQTPDGPSYAPSSCHIFTAFVSEATNMTSNSPADGRPTVYLRFRPVGKIGRTSNTFEGVEFISAGDPKISSDCAYVTFTATLPSTPDRVEQPRVYRYKTQNGAIEQVSPTSADGTRAAGRPSISADGRYIAYQYAIPNRGGPANYSDIYVRDMHSGTVEKVSTAHGGRDADRESTGPVISADGRRVAFDSYAANLVPGDTNRSVNVFVRDLDQGRTTIVKGAGSKVCTRSAALSADGGHVAYVQRRLSDTDGPESVYLRDLTTGVTRLISVDVDGGRNDHSAGNPAVNEDGSAVAFDSASADLVPGDTNGESDVFVRWLRQPGTTR